MAIAPQIVHTCDHIIEQRDDRLGTLTLTRNADGMVDGFASGIFVREIYKVYQVINDNTLDYEFYHNRKDFNLSGGRTINWISEHKPTNGTTYYAECKYIMPEIIEYEDIDCPRCIGNGWYVDFLPQSELEVQVVTGMSKVVQDFLKIVFTYRVEGSTYGTKLADYAGMAILDANQISSEIATLFYNAADQYKELQASALLDNNKLTDSELLESISVDSIEYDRESSAFYVFVTLYSQAGESTELVAGI